MLPSLQKHLISLSTHSLIFPHIIESCLSITITLSNSCLNQLLNFCKSQILAIHPKINPECTLLFALYIFLKTELKRKGIDKISLDVCWRLISLLLPTVMGFSRDKKRPSERLFVGHPSRSSLPDSETEVSCIEIKPWSNGSNSSLAWHLLDTTQNGLNTKCRIYIFLPIILL